MPKRSAERGQKEPDIKAFLADLTDLSIRYGIAIAGKPELFVLEPEDHASSYRIDEESRLSFS